MCGWWSCDAKTILGFIKNGMVVLVMNWWWFGVVLGWSEKLVRWIWDSDALCTRVLQEMMILYATMVLSLVDNSVLSVCKLLACLVQVSTWVHLLFWICSSENIYTLIYLYFLLIPFVNTILFVLQITNIRRRWWCRSSFSLRFYFSSS
jgi:hypothetical protein